MSGRAELSKRGDSLRILHVIDSVDPVSGGPGEAVRQLTRIYQSGGYEVEVASLDAPEDIQKFNFPAPVHGLGPGKGVYGYTPQAEPWFMVHVNSYNLVLLHCIWQYQVLAAYRALSRVGVPYGVFTHGMLDPYFKKTFPLKHVKKQFYWHLFLRRIVNNANAVLFTCEEEKLLARNAFAGYRVREKVLNFGIFAPKVNLISAKEEFLTMWPHLRGKRIAITMGRLHPKKGVDILITAFARSLAKYPEWELVIAGPDQVGQQADLHALAMRLGVAERITWTGMVNGSMKWGALAAAEVFVLPSHQENFGIVVAEALACSVPVIISDKVNIWREIQSSNAGLICQDSVASAEAALNQWSQFTEAEISELRDHCLKCFNDFFNYDVTRGKVLELTESLSKESPHR
jgi:glycosyltransferase involved in cell wall biosynthesis